MVDLLAGSIRWNQVLAMVFFILLALCVHFFVLGPMRRRAAVDRQRFARRIDLFAKVRRLRTPASATHLAVLARNPKAASLAVQEFEEEVNKLSSTDDLFAPSVELLAAAKQACEALVGAEEGRVDRDTLHLVECYSQWAALVDARTLAEAGGA